MFMVLKSKKKPHSKQSIEQVYSYICSVNKISFKSNDTVSVSNGSSADIYVLFTENVFIVIKVLNIDTLSKLPILEQRDHLYHVNDLLLAVKSPNITCSLYLGKTNVDRQCRCEL